MFESSLGTYFYVEFHQSFLYQCDSEVDIISFNC